MGNLVAVEMQNGQNHRRRQSRLRNLFECQLVRDGPVSACVADTVATMRSGLSKAAPWRG